MPDGYTHLQLTEVKDSAAEFGFEERMEARFAGRALAAERTGVSYERIKPGKRQAFGHRHDRVEEIYVIARGSGRLKLDDEVIEVAELDAIRVAPEVTRCWEAGDEGLTVIAFGEHDEDDKGEILMGWWDD